eukprot:TRINITY_DN16136_c0_g1_i1.p1 TRINITY_DN16136_c0_g1~~TRINITY_DN16136_c0_g1_i1.p1  ORF type:complete len:401 (+),score=72.44 TRINITY_DN16136_c0_g1_i1:220-1422(+)
MAAAVQACTTSRLFAPRLPLAQQRAQPSASSIPLPQAAFHGRERCSADSAAPCSSRRPEKLRGDFLGSRPVCLAEGRQAPRQRSGVVCSGEPVGTSAVAELPGSRIWMSDVVARPKRNYFLDRQWTSKDLVYAGFMLFMHGACLLAPFTFSWNAFAVFAGLYFITGCLGITLSFHRNLSHKSFKLPKPLEYLFAYCGIQAVQGDPIEWVSSHRYHHIHCDTENDPHTPKEGFWHSHMGWLLDDEATQDRVGKRTNVADMENDAFYKFIQKTYPLHPLAAAVALFALGGLPYLVWGMAVRVVWVYHITWFVNSASHVWGSQSWNTGDLSRNNWWVALLAFGEGWHNNHHAFEYSARHGLEWWQFDPTWYIILAMEKLGLATKVKLPRADHMARLAPAQPAA